MITFKAKPLKVYDITGTKILYELIKIPKITTKHCDMDLFRAPTHKLSGVSNSDLFESVLRRELRIIGIESGTNVKLNELRHNPNIKVNTSKFLYTVSIKI
jgi:hypothetical protein